MAPRLKDTKVKVYDPLIDTHYEYLEKHAGDGSVTVPGTGRAQVAATLRTESGGATWPWVLTPSSGLYSVVQVAVLSMGAIAVLDCAGRYLGGIDLRPTSALWVILAAGADFFTMFGYGKALTEVTGELVNRAPRWRRVEPFLFDMSTASVKEAVNRFDDIAVVLQRGPRVNVTHVDRSTADPFYGHRRLYHRALLSVAPELRDEFRAQFDAQEAHWMQAFSVNTTRLLVDPFPLTPIMRVWHDRAGRPTMTATTRKFIDEYGVTASNMYRALMIETNGKLTDIQLREMASRLGEKNMTHVIPRFEEAYATVRKVFDDPTYNLTYMDMRHLHDFNRVLHGFTTTSSLAAGGLFPVAIGHVPLHQRLTPVTDKEARAIGFNESTAEARVAAWLSLDLGYIASGYAPDYIARTKRTKLSAAEALYREYRRGSDKMVTTEEGRQRIRAQRPTAFQAWGAEMRRTAEEQWKRGAVGGPHSGATIVQNIGGYLLRATTLGGVSDILDRYWTRASSGFFWGKPAGRLYFGLVRQMRRCYESSLHLSTNDVLVMGDVLALALFGLDTSWQSWVALVGATSGIALYSLVMQRLLRWRLQAAHSPEQYNSHRHLAMIRAMPGIVRTVTFGFVSLTMGAVSYGMAATGHRMVDYMLRVVYPTFVGVRASGLGYAWFWLSQILRGDELRTPSGQSIADLRSTWTLPYNVMTVELPTIASLTHPELFLLRALDGLGYNGGGTGTTATVMQLLADHTGYALAFFVFIHQIMQRTFRGGFAIIPFMSSLALSYLVSGIPEAQYFMLGALRLLFYSDGRAASTLSGLFWDSMGSMKGGSYKNIESGEFLASVREQEEIRDLITKLNERAEDTTKALYSVRLTDDGAVDEPHVTETSGPPLPLPLALLAEIDARDQAASPVPVFPLPV